MAASSGASMLCSLLCMFSLLAYMPASMAYLSRIHKMFRHTDSVLLPVQPRSLKVHSQEIVDLSSYDQHTSSSRQTRRAMQGQKMPAAAATSEPSNKFMGGIDLRLVLRTDFVQENATLEERLAAFAQHDAARLQALNTQINDAIVANRGNQSGQFSSSAKFSVNAGPGVFMIEVMVGTPARTFPMIMDTGSQLVWMQCQPCQSCVTQSTQMFAPTESSSYETLPCSSSACQSLPGQCGSGSSCQYTYSYASQASTQGLLGSDTLSLVDSGGSPFYFNNMAFGCGYANQGDYGGAAGLVGMGQSPLSLPSQLGQALGGKKFSYCLLSQTGSSPGEPTSLLMGSAATQMAAGSGSMQYTPMVSNPAVVASLYYINVVGFSVNNQMLSIPAGTFSIGGDGAGGMILDSGTTYTYLPKAAFDVLQQAFDNSVRLPKYSSHPYLPLCYATSGQPKAAIPSLSLLLQGVDLALPLDNYFIPVDSQGNYCLAMIPTSGGLQIIGNMLHQNFQVLYDLDNSRIGFASGAC